MPMFMCRWPNGDVSFVFERSKDEAIIALDEWDNAELAEVRQMKYFMADFHLSSSGELCLKGFGEGCYGEIWDHAYPMLDKTLLEAPTDKFGKLTAKGKRLVAAAVRMEKRRLWGKKARKLADTELGRAIQDQLGAPSVLINRYVKDVATQTLDQLSDSDRKQ